MQQGAFARAGLAHDGQHLLPFDEEVYVLKKNQPTPSGGILFAQIADLDQRVVLVPRVARRPLVASSAAAAISIFCLYGR